MHLQISPSQLETFRKFYEEVFDGMVTEQDVIEAVKRRTSYKPEMGTGEAYHKVIEQGHEKFHKPDIAINHYEVPVQIWYEEKRIEVTEIFTYAELLPAIRYREKHKGLIFEVPNHWNFEYGEYQVTIEMRMDAMHGNYVHENKTVYSSWKMEGFENSLPWQIYLVSADSPRITFNIFEILSKREEDIQRRVSCFSFDLYREEQMEYDIKDWVGLYIQFLEIHNLLNYAKRR